ncbi:TlpA family protein disulfide reductase [Niabella beijingensis]|uniref:TlpA family protein disulfide reductase n=1 Tax=Niabella beijingensis TaxID=2872700 RepID=UPI001CBECB03|nr:redoxin family protein [Niabella beijingensis]MBZ4190448.1 redoxin family protein [Niabella beijingensis]
MKKTTLTGVAATLCTLVKKTLPVTFCCLLLPRAHAQDAVFIPVEKPDTAYLTIGDTVPDITLYPTACATDSFKLSSLKARLVLLDVWSTTCVPCIRQFPKLDSLQQEFKGALQLLLVTINGNAKEAAHAEAVLHQLEAGRGKKLLLPSVSLTRQATSLFFFQVNTPHYIWLDANRRIIAATGAEAVTAATIKALLDGRPVTMQMKPTYIPLDTLPPVKNRTVQLTL